MRHALLHLPMHPDCTVCQIAKISRTPARATPDSLRATTFGARVYIDLIGPVPPDFLQNRYLLVARDEATDFPFVAALPDKQSATVANKFRKLVTDAGISLVRPDWGKEFEGQFEKTCERMEIEIERGAPEKVDELCSR